MSTRGIAFLVEMLTKDKTIAYTFALNLVATLLLMYDWNLFGIHYNRMKEHPHDFILYTILGLILFGGWLTFNQRFLNGFALEPDRTIMQRYAFALPAIAIAFSFSQSLIINIGFKCLTDHFDIREKELLIILASGFLFGLFYTVVFLETFTLDYFVRTYLYNVILVSFLSYLYNQSSSFLPGLLSLGLVMLVLQFI